MLETRLRATLIAWLRDDAVLSASFNAITEEAPERTAVPWLGIVASASTDWSAKDRKGREVRMAMELHMRGDDPETGTTLVSAVEARIEALPRDHAGFAIITTQFLRARAEQRSANQRAILLEYRFRLLEA